MLDANKNLIMLYFKIGKIICENSNYGSKFINNIATEIKVSFPQLKGFSVRNLKYMKRFYLEYFNDEKVQQFVALLPWGHNVVLMEKIKDKKIRKLYIQKTIENGWSRNVLEMQIKSNYHLRIGTSANNFKETCSFDDSDLINATIKDPYIFDFITLRDNYNEKELEKAMINRIKDVLLELGNGFSFVGNQYKLVIGNNDYYIDLLFYHLKLKCYIIVELKNTNFKPEYVGKMNFYLSAVDDLVKDKFDNNSIGLILCNYKNKMSVRYALKGINKPIGVSSYEISKLLPDDIMNALPTEEDLNLHLDL